MYQNLTIRIFLQPLHHDSFALLFRDKIFCIYNECICEQHTTEHTVRSGAGSLAILSTFVTTETLISVLKSKMNDGSNGI